MLKQFTIISIIALIVLSGCSRQVPKIEKSDEKVLQTSSNPQYAAELICYIGKIGSGSNCSMVIYDPNKPENSKFIITNQSMKCGIKGQVSEISWTFIKHSKDNDIYSFTRLFQADTNESKSTTKITEFNGKQTIIFEDEYQVIVLDTPK